MPLTYQLCETQRVRQLRPAIGLLQTILCRQHLNVGSIYHNETRTISYESGAKYIIYALIKIDPPISPLITIHWCLDLCLREPTAEVNFFKTHP